MADQVDKSPGITTGQRAVAVTPSDATVQANRFISLHNATATGGTVAITDQFDNAVTLYLTPGQNIACRPRLIKAAGTTVATITGFLE